LCGKGERGICMWAEGSTKHPWAGDGLNGGGGGHVTITQKRLECLLGGPSLSKNCNHITVNYSTCFF
jgi:hypothetical protein